ncbi:hypothetical protein F5X68DRAFT_212372 [Plectosphaerella plurivora]|uniref:Pathway-specific nitrogen regulator n=1 Tax=Plectosphaerella plurivora TaxID=936078 RepID=A0A9P8V803_9PEZI|nr:hypothetical protein F5X68DRAFT_212372 [Plectosphaerella plurivora]
MVRQRDPDSVFDIHVDPSCLSTPMDEDAPPAKTPEAGEEQAHDTKADTEDISVEQMLQDTVDELQSQQDKATVTALEDDTAGDESILTTTTDTAEEGTEADTESRRSSNGDRRISGRTDALIQAAARAVVDQIERQRQEDAQPYLAGSVMESAINDRSYTDASDASFMTETETEHQDEDSRRESFVSESQATEDRRESIVSESVATEDRRESILSESQATDDRRESAVSEQATEDRRESAISEKSSISEKAMVDKRDSIISESQASNHRDSITSQSRASNPRDSLTSHPERAPSAQGSVIQTPSRISLADDSSRRGSNTPSHARTDSDDLDLDRDHDRDSEVFSDRSHSHSARSSLGSFEDHRSYKSDNLESAFGRRADAEARSPRVSDFSQYDDREDFVPTIRGNPRPPFRTPSDVRALQMAVSPPPSVFAGVSPRSSKRHHLPTISRLGSPTPSIQYSPKGRTTPSRLKPRKTTPPLVLLHATILPLRWPWGDVLEDAPSDTLTPDAKTLRETWRFLHDRLGDTVCERGVLLPHPQGDYEILEERLLDALELPLRRRARILECGHYVGPANELTLTEDLDSDADDASDFGGSHAYSRQGSSAFMSPSRSTLGLSGPQTHWCATCRHDIKFEALGPGKVFRVKVYASNGLMKAGAWSACWKEMERVDVEIEPIIKGPELQDELETLATRQQEAAERAAEEEDAAQAAAELDESIIEETYVGEHHQLPPSSPPAAVEDVPASPSPGSSISRHDQVEERRLRDEARMREIYGDEPEQEPVLPEAASPQPSDSVPLPSAESYANQHASPTSPSEEARARRDARRSSRHRESSDLKNATLPELLLEAVRVMLQDRKNVALVLLSCLVLFLAVKPAQSDVQLGEWNEAYIHRDVEAAIPKVPVMEVKMEPEVKVVEEAQVPPVEEVPPVEQVPSVEAVAPEQKPCLTPEPVVEASPEVVKQVEEQQKLEALVGEEDQEKSKIEEPVQEREEDAAPVTIKETVTSREVVRVFETITETVKAYATETIPMRVEESGLPVKEEESLPIKEEESFQVKDEETLPVNDLESIHVQDEETLPVKDEETLPLEDAQSVPLEDTDSPPLENTKSLVEDSEILDDINTSAPSLGTAPEDTPATEQEL